MRKILRHSPRDIASSNAPVDVVFMVWDVLEDEVKDFR